MRLTRIVSLFSAALILGASATIANAQDVLPTEKECSKLENKSTEIAGWCAAVNRRQGNCLSCHIMVTPKWPEGFPPGGNTAPPLVAMKSRYPNKADLRVQVNDAREANPDTLMPPFGTHRLLTQEQIDNIVEFLYTL